MPLSALELDTISRGFQAAKKVLDEVKPVVDLLNIIYDAQGGVKSTVTQGELNEYPQFSGLTKAQLDDGFFVLTSTLREALANGYTALAHLAAR